MTKYIILAAYTVPCTVYVSLALLDFCTTGTVEQAIDIVLTSQIGFVIKQLLVYKSNNTSIQVLFSMPQTSGYITPQYSKMFAG